VKSNNYLALNRGLSLAKYIPTRPTAGKIKDIQDKKESPKE
jgi:hypothetical protein